MTSTLTEEEWQLVWAYYGDVAHQHPELHAMMLNIAKAQEITAKAKAILERTPDVPPEPCDEMS
ncbi:hypothetical protein [Rhizobium sp. 42MFCr.1]|uniref:hypothetical protein n=1 Tax=Rhizobium sp. 42MFCr.1 TaxID=1048680 RepID=UPI0003654550|nr:hypothetical protein [Rhizobium sp. 42MFCr.1]